MPRPVSIVTVTHDTYFFARLLVEKVREFVGRREYEIVVVDRSSRDGTVEWLRGQSEVRLVPERAPRRGHGHGEAAERGISEARCDYVVLLDSDAHPVTENWLELTVDQLDQQHRLAGPVFRVERVANPYGRYVHPHFMAFQKRDLGELITLRRPAGGDLDTGELATIRVLEAGFRTIEYPIEFCDRFAVGHPHFPTISAGVFHAWYGTRLGKESPLVRRETGGVVTEDNYLRPLQQKLREEYALDY